MLHKKMNKSGGITIPQQLRHELGLGAGTAFDIEPAGNGIIITKHSATCRLCGSQDNVLDVNSFEICKSCSDEIARRFDLCK